MANYTHVLQMLDNFHCQSLKEYMSLYLLSYICLQADAF